MMLSFVDSHTAGEPTRILTSFPSLVGESVAEQAADLASRFPWVYAATLGEPRGNDVWVGGILLPHTNDYDFGVIFYNTTGNLGMCGHGTIGLGVTLQRLGRLGVGTYTMGTPAGLVTVNILGRNDVSLRNVLSYRDSTGVACGSVTGDIAYGGNWFYICQDHGLALSESVWSLEKKGQALMAELAHRGITGADGARIDHVEYVWPGDDTCDARNFVITPSGAFDRSPCGTGTSAKLACLAGDGKLQPGESWRVRGISGECFEASYELAEGGVRPTIRGQAFITAEGALHFDDLDPLRHGLTWA
ncbi:MAG: proline racemase family protein [Chthonomonas sp.]|nr:proline racemase family protein [Chthonomonas sp.]